MKTLVIVEDEKRERDALCELINGHFDGEISIVGVTSDSDSAYSSVLEHRPDIVLLDIQIPGMNGLVLADKLRTENWDGEIVILTAHKSFDYAQWALELRAAQYLLKPVDTDRLIQVLRQTSDLIDSRRLIQKADEPELSEIGRRFRPIAEQEFFREVLLRRVDPMTTIDRYCRVLEIPSLDGICFALWADSAVLSDRQTMEALRSRVWKGNDRVLSSPIGNAFAYVVSSQKPADMLYRLAEEGVKRGARFLERVTGSAHNWFVSTTFCDLETLQVSFNECLVKHQEDRDEPGPASNRFDIEKQLSDAILDCNTRSVVGAVHELVETWFVESADFHTTGNTEWQEEHSLRVIFGAVEHRLHERFGDRSPQIDYASFDRVGSGAGFQEVLDIALQVALKLVQALENITETPSHRTVRLAREYIEAHYFEPLTLSEVASEAAVSTFHLSRLFKQIDGVTFKEALTRTRVVRAKDLLAEGTYTVDEAARAVGYSDGSALHKAFRRVEGEKQAGRHSHAADR